MASRQEQVLAILDRLAENTMNEVVGAVAVSTDGIVLAARIASEINADRVGAVAATLIGVNKRVSGELRIGAPDETILKAATGLFMVLPAGDQAVLAVTMRQGANLGMVRLEARDAATALSSIL